ncbi:long-chain-fatty-acid--CoA ligase [Streptomyces violens]|uniref:long-chain-fatty-acid--CoA ligase n=1 Tax=Streptomyces violens TaxID=66377 RepID=UPI0004C08AC1|nr:long-chain-fatty-acid--CoA ligase [Streptomyces violens]
MNDDTLTRPRPAVRPRTLDAVAARQAADRPGHPAVLCEGRQLTYAELHRESNRTAHALLAAGLGPGSRVAYLGKESEHFYDIALACAKTGAVLVPVNWRLTRDEIAHILGDSDTELLFAERERLAVAGQLGTVLPKLREVVPLDSGEDRGAGFLAWKADRPERDLAAGSGPDDAVAQIYTSGTTGLPKGVVLAHRSFFNVDEAFTRHGCDWVDWQPGDRCLIGMPGFHIGGLSYAMQGFVAGATMVSMPMFVAGDVLRQIGELGLTHGLVTPAMLQMLLDEPGAGPAAFRSVRKMIYGGAPISGPLLRRCLETMGCEFAQIYGSTETGNFAACLPPADHVPGSHRLTAAGRAYPGIDLRIADEDGTALPPGAVGEVWVRTPARMLGYHRQPAATRETVRDGWVRMGDAGRLDDDGYLFLCDRINDTVIIGGENVYPTEIEHALAGHPAVAEAAVVGVPDERWGEAVHAYVVLRPGQQATPRELMRFLRGRLADFKIPTAYEFLAELPRNPNGKVLRRTLRDRLWQGRERKVN